MAAGNTFKMAVVVIAIVAILLCLAQSSDATYRKPPFNGSIFGKRGTSNEYDSAAKALSAMCEIANEACASWFLTLQETNK